MSLPVLHPDSWREPLRDRVMRWLFVHLITPSYRLDMASHGAVAEIIAASIEKENLK